MIEIINNTKHINKIIVEYVVNNDGKLRKIKTNIEELYKIVNKLQDKYKTNEISIKFITKN